MIFAVAMQLVGFMKAFAKLLEDDLGVFHELLFAFACHHDLAKASLVHHLVHVHLLCFGLNNSLVSLESTVHHSER